jgi:hypothetical protein
MHPEMKTYAHFEHIIAFAILGALFGFAYRDASCLCAALSWAAPRFWKCCRR